ncbi:methyl-accepting chemotaxis protein [Parasalinivibrio latis]|uniref:methyl-accepting chemotaxis protein n=1 Tax=Parasalinivibrio latis TaxID=2952610 RepID=UPI0030E0AD97
MTIKFKLYFTLALMSVAIVIVGLFGDQMMDWQNGRIETTALLNRVDKDIGEARVHQLRYMLEGSEDSVEQVNAYLLEAEEALQIAREGIDDEDKAFLLDTVAENLRSFNEQFTLFKLENSKLQEDLRIENKQGEELIKNTAKLVTFANNINDKNSDSMIYRSLYVSSSALYEASVNLFVSVLKSKSTQGVAKGDQISKLMRRTYLKLKGVQMISRGKEVTALIKNIESSYNSYKASVEKNTKKVVTVKNIESQLVSAALSTTTNIEMLYEQNAEDGQAVSDNAKRVTYMVIVGSIIFSIFVSIWIVRTIMAPLNKSIVFASSIAEGDLSKRIDTKGKDEFTVLNNALNKSAESLSDIVEKLRQASSSISGSCQTMESSIQQSNDSVREQLDDTSAIAQSLSEMTTGAMSISENANDATEQSQLAANAAQEGERVLEQSVAAIEKLSLAMTEASSAVDKLKDDSENIGNILNVIRGIAEQTNLLALNAAIEAARAGELGRGFAVVADEVRALAGKTQESVEEITEIVETIQGGAANVVTVISQSNDRSQEVQTLSEQSGEAYYNIAKAINTIVSYNEQVSAAATEQSAVAEEITQNVVRVTKNSEENTSQLASIAEQSETQSQQANALNNIIGIFRI